GETGSHALQPPRPAAEAPVKLVAGLLAAALLFGGSAKRPRLAGVSMFPADNPWNMRVDGLPVAANSDAIIASIGPDAGLHPDFGSGKWDGGPIGIRYNVATSR